MRARLTIEAGDARPGELDLEPNDSASLGRSRDNTVVLRSEHASRLHAKVYFENGRWYVRDFSLNGTLLNGQRMPQQQAELDHGHEIRVGDIRVRFTLQDTVTSTQVSRVSTTSSLVAVPPTTARLPASDASVLSTFMAGQVGETDPHLLLRQALILLQNQTGAYVVGFVTADPSDPLPKVVYPDSASIDPAMCRNMTRKVQREGRTAWLGTDLTDTRPTDTLKEVTDAAAVPVRTTGVVLGLLHIYKKGEFFAERDVRFTEALAEFLAGCLKSLRVRRNLEAEVARLRSHPPPAEELIGDSGPMVRLRQQIAHAAAQPFPVLIRGEAGVGLELVAEQLHRLSPRSVGPFVALGCAALAPALFESELFGGRTAGDAGSGRVQAADDGTLFIDEIAALPMDCQNRLVHVIEDRTFRPAGSATELRSDARIIAATQFDLEAAVEKVQFRKQLFDRLSTLVIDVPPLRSHLEDVPFLVQYFLDRLAVEAHRQVEVTEAAMHKLAAYLWPGNLRQLRAELEVAALRSNRNLLDEADVLVGCERLLIERTAKPA
ncbi:MAG: sigma-54-dependent Fis family transcriptional regulator [Gemmataceae bacterium]